MKVNPHPSKEAIEIIPEPGSLSQIAQQITSSYNETKLHLVINLTEFTSNLELKDLLEFLKLSNHYKSNKKSLVIIAPQINVDQVPEELAIVPSLHEAFDLIEMENIERDLGF